MRSVSGVGRVAAIGAVIVTIALVAIILFGGSSAYTVKAVFANAGQLVKGNPVQTGGVADCLGSSVRYGRPYSRRPRFSSRLMEAQPGPSTFSLKRVPATQAKEVSG
jgi:hypothetical protein